MLFKSTTTKYQLAGKTVPRGTPGASPVRLQSRKWYGRYSKGGKTVTVALHQNKATALAMLGKLMAGPAPVGERLLKDYARRAWRPRPPTTTSAT
jgi:hypothetical protein